MNKLVKWLIIIGVIVLLGIFAPTVLAFIGVAGVSIVATAACVIIDLIPIILIILVVLYVLKRIGVLK